MRGYADREPRSFTADTYIARKCSLLCLRWSRQRARALSQTPIDPRQEWLEGQVRRVRELVLSKTKLVRPIQDPPEIAMYARARANGAVGLLGGQEPWGKWCDSRGERVVILSCVSQCCSHNASSNWDQGAEHIRNTIDRVRPGPFTRAA
jgi:hypothetical protein